MKNVSLFKYDQQLHYEWSSHVIEETDDYVLLYAGTNAPASYSRCLLYIRLPFARVLHAT